MRARTSTSVLVPLLQIFHFCRFPSPPSYSDTGKGRKQVFHTHIYNDEPPGKVQQEVTALGITLGARQEPCRAGEAVGVSGSGGRCCGGNGICGVSGCDHVRGGGRLKSPYCTW